MTSQGDQDQTLGRVLEAFSLIIGRWTAVGMADLILERAGVDSDAASMTLLLELRRSGGSARPSHLAQATRTGASNVSKVLARMVRDGLVERTAEQGDLRAVSIVLTDKGHRTAEVIDGTSVEMLGELMKDWPEDDIGRLGELLSRFAQALRTSFPP